MQHALTALCHLHKLQIEVLNNLQVCKDADLKAMLIEQYAGYSKQIIEIIEPEHEPTLQATFGKKEATKC